jgi:hypothetical protein
MTPQQAFEAIVDCLDPHGNCDAEDMPGEEVEIVRAALEPAGRQSMNAQRVYCSLDADGKPKQLFVRIPRENAAESSMQCICQYCKDHPDEPSLWDCLCIELDRKAKSSGYTWTVHFPDLERAKGVQLWQK